MTDPLTAAWLSEMWKPCPEWHQTVDERAEAVQRNATLNRASTPSPQNDAQPSTGCAEIGSDEPPEGSTKCA